MTFLVGGVRTRMVHDSFVHMVEDALTLLHWFDRTIHDNPPGPRDHYPLHAIARPNDWDDNVAFNSYAITSDDVTDRPAEMGSTLTEDTHVFTIDIYCEDDEIGTHLKDDLRDILRGKMPSIGRDRPILDVYDYSAATPPLVFYCELERVTADRAHDFPKMWQQHWWSIRCDVVDTFGDEDYQ